MKKSIVTIFFLGSFLLMPFLKAFGQDTCHIFNNLKFKNGVDTIVIKATYDALVKSPDYSILKELEKENKLKYDDFGVDTAEEDASAMLSFIPENCSTPYLGTLSGRIVNVIPDTLKHGKIIYLTCVVFEGKTMGIQNYFLITGIELKASYYDPYPSITNKRYLEDIPHMPIRAPGENKYFAFADWPLSARFFILGINANGIACIKFNGDNIFFKRTKHLKRTLGYTDKFFNKNYKLILNITSSKKAGSHSSMEQGFLEVISKDGDLQFPVHARISNIHTK